MSICNRCWPWCREPPAENPYEETPTVRPTFTPSNTLTTLTIAEGKAEITVRKITDGESKRKFSPTMPAPPPVERIAIAGHVRFVSTEIVSVSDALKQPPKNGLAKYAAGAK